MEGFKRRLTRQVIRTSVENPDVIPSAARDLLFL